MYIYIFFIEFFKFNALNIPTHERQHQLKVCDMIGQGAILIKELTHGLSNFYTYCEQRSAIYPYHNDGETISLINKKVKYFTPARPII